MAYFITPSLFFPFLTESIDIFIPVYVLIMRKRSKKNCEQGSSTVIKIYSACLLGKI